MGDLQVISRSFRTMFRPTLAIAGIPWLAGFFSPRTKFLWQAWSDSRISWRSASPPR